MLSLLDKDQLDRRIIESKFGANSNLTKYEMQEELQKSILDNKQKILQQQANLLGGKNSVMASLMSDRADVSGMFESQTATIPVGSMMDNLYDNLIHVYLWNEFYQYNNIIHNNQTVHFSLLIFHLVV